MFRKLSHLFVESFENLVLAKDFDLIRRWEVLLVITLSWIHSWKFAFVESLIWADDREKIDLDH